MPSEQITDERGRHLGANSHMNELIVLFIVLWILILSVTKPLGSSVACVVSRRDKSHRHLHRGRPPRTPPPLPPTSTGLGEGRILFPRFREDSILVRPSPALTPPGTPSSRLCPGEADHRRWDQGPDIPVYSACPGAEPGSDSSNSRPSQPRPTSRVQLSGKRRFLPP